ncbi:MerR family transcriptional regulator [Deinococcus sp. SDU3-2]|uniref:MerR family transcriptional regulator n=1 Tax=Deinococcus terrestris TaxID=2651870 RepID=A0A7X1TSP5_9DEIO|nr:MerR family transcriptional regulator [Deinococcus terrestris]MPY67676.1 MerR family transcriptional regulator [Deinococcus terrestris]
MRLSLRQLARRSGLPVSTLRHYEQLGLLAPVGRAASGQGLYSDSALRTIQQVQSLEAYGLSLARIQAVLRRPEQDPQPLLGEQIRALEENVTRRQALLDRLKRLDLEEVSGSELLEVIRLGVRVEKTFGGDDHPGRLDKDGQELT